MAYHVRKNDRTNEEIEIFVRPGLYDGLKWASAYVLNPETNNYVLLVDSCPYPADETEDEIANEITETVWPWDETEDVPSE